MNLKPLRVRIGLTQKEMAEKLGTTQQTVARWESGANAVPTKHLKDLAVFLGCTVADLLDIDEAGVFKRRKDEGKEESEDGHLPYGAVRLAFENDLLVHERAKVGKSRSYGWPITWSVRASLIGQLQKRSGWASGDGDKGWLSFETLDDRYVFVNPACLESIAFLSDDVEEAPRFEHPEVYEAINMVLGSNRSSDEQPDSDEAPVSRKLIEQAKATIEEWGGIEPARILMEDLIVERRDGVGSNLPIEEENVQELFFGLLEDPKASADRIFGKLSSDGASEGTYFRFGCLRLIELSALRFQALEA